MDRGQPVRLETPRYCVALIAAWPAHEPVLFPSLYEHPTTSLVVLVAPVASAAWHAEIRSRSSEARFWQTKDPDWCCVLVDGQLYWFDVREPAPARCQDVAFVGDTRFVFVGELDLLVAFGGSNTDVTAYDRAGVRWCTGPIALDDVSDVTFEGDIMRGIADGPLAETYPFTIDLRSGACEGGWRFEPVS